MSKHTPGEWVYEQISRGSRDGFEISSGNFYKIAEVYDVNGSPQNEANARLIAAAPKLLSMLKEMVEATEIDLGADDFLALKREAIAVIAKAEGKSNV